MIMVNLQKMIGLCLPAHVIALQYSYRSFLKLFKNTLLNYKIEGKVLSLFAIFC